MKKIIFLLLLGCTAICRGGLLQFDLSPPGSDAAGGLSPQNEVIPGASNGAGGEIGPGISFDTTSLTLSLSVGYGSSAGFTDLTGPGFAFFLHAPAHPGETAPVLFDLSGLHTFAPDHARGGTISGSIVYTPAQANDLLAGLDYINIYTDANPGGEIRGQLIMVPEPGTFALGAMGALAVLGAVGARRKKVGSLGNG